MKEIKLKEIKEIRTKEDEGKEELLLKAMLDNIIPVEELEDLIKSEEITLTFKEKEEK